MTDTEITNMHTRHLDKETLAQIHALAAAGDEACRRLVGVCEDWKRKEMQMKCVACEENFDRTRPVEQFQATFQDADDTLIHVTAACTDCIARGKRFIVKAIMAKFGGTDAHFV